MLFRCPPFGNWYRRARRCAVVLPAVLILVALLLRAQTPATMTRQLPTEQRLLQPGWWPTKRTADRGGFVGPAKCAECHAGIAATQSGTAMALTMPAASTILRSDEQVRFRFGPYRYEIQPGGNVVKFAVSDGQRTVAEPLDWVFGSGRTGKSFLFAHSGSTYEARLSFITLLQRFDITPGQSTSPPTSLDKALGRRMSDEETRKCFDCHATAAVTPTSLDTAHMMRGVTCEACHGPGADHVLAMAPPRAEQALILNPARMTPVESVDFCGACHRTWWDTMALGFTGVMTVRFPAYRLERSRCWGSGDRRLTCVACHDPHRDLVRDPVFYDSRCLACHVAGANAKPTADHPGAACPKGARLCVTCHMQKYELPDMNLMFTDHQIRVSRKGEKFPG